MAPGEEEQAARNEKVFRRFQQIETSDPDPEAGQLAHLVRARWVILLILFLYGGFAGIFYSFSRFGFFLSANQAGFLLLTFCVVVLYNLSYQNASRRLSRFRYRDHLQVFLDQLLVTVLVHFSGGSDSWVWPLYLIVSIEGVYLLNRSRDVWFTWASGAILYGALLLCEHGGIICGVAMPFVDPALSGDLGYLLLIWIWVAILNGAVSVVGFHLMSVSRRDTLQLKESRQRLFAFLEHADDLIQLNALDGRFIYANRAWLQAMGYRKGEIAPLDLLDVVLPESRSALSDEFRRVFASGGTGTLEARYLTRGGDVLVLEGNLTCSFRGSEPDAVWGISRDVTSKKLADQELYRRAHHDVLTDLPNRQLFMDRLQQLRAMMNRSGRCMAVLYLDLDRFKNVNDTLGHDFGDKLLQEVARRMTATVRETDTVARLGGDEFVIGLGNLHDEAGAEVVAGKVLKALSAPYLIEGQDLLMTSSVGIGVYPRHARELEELVKKADQALYLAKAQGRGCYRSYSDLPEGEGHSGSWNGTVEVHGFPHPDPLPGGEGALSGG
jgi:diguanylate cyclase (GGDEF)-like protein/PAS domain S-box-containing protein